MSGEVGVEGEDAVSMGVGLAARATAREGGNTPGLPCIVRGPHPPPRPRRAARC